MEDITITAQKHQQIAGLSRGSITFMVLAAACWGFATVISKGVLVYVPPISLLVVQLIASVSCLWTILIVRRVRVKIDRRTLRFGITGLLEPGFAYTLSLVGLTLTTASMSTLIWAVEPVIILGLAWVILRERLTRSMIGLSILAVLGVFLVVGIGVETSSMSILIGNMLTLIGVFCCALYIVLTRRISSLLDALPLIALQQTFALAWVVGIWPIELVHVRLSSLQMISSSVWGWAVLSGFVSFTLGFWFYIIGLKRTTASLAGLSLNLIPIFGVGGAYLFLGERLGLTQLAGAALILVSVASIFHFQRKAKVSDFSCVRSQTS